MSVCFNNKDGEHFNLKPNVLHKKDEDLFSVTQTVYHILKWDDHVKRLTCRDCPAGGDYCYDTSIVMNVQCEYNIILLYKFFKFFTILFCWCTH